MKIKEFYEKIRHNHGLMMLVCCIAPLLILVGAVYLFGISKSYLYWFILLLCPLLHIWMMKDMHKDMHKPRDKPKEGEVNQ